MPPRRWTDADLIAAVARNTTIIGVLRDLGLSSSPGNYRTVHRLTAHLGIDTKHFLGQSHLRGRDHPSRTTLSLDQILVEDSTYTNGTSLKRRLIHAGLLKEQCAGCSTGSVWQGKPLVLQLEHRNGNPRDHRIENLCLLCPNCHSQTSTFTSRSPGRYTDYKKARYYCIDCGDELSGKRWDRCSACSAKANARSKIGWPEPAVILERVRATSYSAVGRELGVSGEAVKKHLKTRGAL